MNKRIRISMYVVYLTLTFAVVIVLFTQGAAKLLAFFRRGADIDDLFMVATEHINDFYRPEVNWPKEHRNEGRQVIEGDVLKLSKDYVASYFYQIQAMNSVENSGIRDYFTDKSRPVILAMQEDMLSKKYRSLGTVITHQPEMKFFSEDGIIASIEDIVVTYWRSQIDETVDYSYYDTSKYEVLLALEDNFWRIRHRVRKPLTDADLASIRTGYSCQNVQMPDFRIQGVNYYPAKYPWQKMWGNFEKIDFEPDLAMIRYLGFNTVRVFVPFEDFGKADVDFKQVQKLTALLDELNRYELHAVVTLFDFFLGYRVEEWTLSDRHAEKIVKALKDHPALLVWDIKNEPDLDFDNIGQKTVIDWLDFMTKRIRVYDSITPITVGWSQPEQLSCLSEELDILSFHYYREPNLLNGILDSMKSTYELNKPLFLSETGMHSFDSWWYPFGKTQEDQLNYYEGIFEAIDSLSLNYATWTVHDFKKVPSNVAGALPWKKKPQQSYGLINKKGESKKVYNFIKKTNFMIQQKSHVKETPSWDSDSVSTQQNHTQ